MREPATAKLLTSAQRAALAFVRDAAARARDHNLARIDRALGAAHGRDEVDGLIGALREGARVTINFHPDRLLSDGRSVAAALLDDGVYRSQFETGISNGSLTAFPGGDRDRWEARMFGRAYQAAEVAGAERPRYGGLDLMRQRNGTCPRFGSCHLRLHARALDWSTFTAGDSYAEPQDIGVIDGFEAVLAGLLEEAAAQGRALGRDPLDAAALVTALRSIADRPPAMSCALDGYVEAQIHAELGLATDAEALVTDPSFDGTETGELLEAIAGRFGLVHERHAGHELAIAEVPADFRGPRMPALASQVVDRHGAASPRLDAATIGRAAASVITEPAQWADFASPADALQHLKYLWHVLLTFGRPSSAR